MRSALTRDRALALAIVLGVFGLYAFRLGAPSLRGDEAFTAIFSRWSVLEIMRALRTTEPHPPLYYLGMHVWMALCGRSELSLRFLSFAPGVLLVPLTYGLGRRLRRPSAGVWAAALVALNPFLLWHGQDARMYALLAALGVGSLLLAIRLAEGATAKPISLWTGYTVVTLAALATHYYAALLVVAENLGFIVSLPKLPHRRERAIRWFSAQAVLLLAFGPWLAYAGGFLLGHSKDWIPSVTPLIFLRRVLRAFSLGTTFNVRYAWPWLLVFGALCGLGVIISWREDLTRAPSALRMLWAALGFPIATTYLISLQRPVFDERYLIATVPIYLLFVGRGLSWLEARWRIASIVLFGFLAVASGYAIYRYHFAPQYAKSPDWRSLMNYVVAHQKPGDILVLNYPDPAQEYYNAERLAYVLLPSAFPVDVVATENSLARLIVEHSRVWLVPVRAANWDREGLVETWLGRYADLVKEKTLPGLQLKLYHTPQRFLQTMHPVNADLGGQVRLLGYDLYAGERHIPSEGSVQPGTTLHLKLYWQALVPLETNYTVFTHLLDADGVMRGQKDGPPLHGDYPMTEWRLGEKLVDCHDITVDRAAPPGIYSLQTGMYEWPSLARLSITDAQGVRIGDHLVLTAIQVAQ